MRFAHLKSNTVFVVLGLILSAVSTSIYTLKGFNALMLVAFASSLVLTGHYFLKNDRSKGKSAGLDYHDVGVAFALVVAFAPVYLGLAYDLPVHVNSDEFVTMALAKQVAIGHDTDPFGLSSHLGFPNFVPYVFGQIARAFHYGVNLQSVRIAHALFSLLTIAFGYLLFRASMPRFLAAGAAVLLGANHAFLAFGRMAMWNNTAVFAETAALSLLLFGLMKRSYFITFWGGAVAGLSAYVYPMARITVVIWALTIGALWIASRSKSTFVELAKLSAVSTFGFFMVIAPIMSASFQNPDYAFGHQKEMSLLTEEGRRLQMEWSGSTSESEIVLTNIKKGLLSFNSDPPEFVDPFTGILLWLGLLVVLFKANKRQGDILALVGFLFIYIISAFALNFAPYIGHLLVIVPFAAYFTIEACRKIAETGTSLLKTKPHTALATSRTIIAILVVVIVFWNLAIYQAYLAKYLREGELLGETARYIDSRLGYSNYTYYLVADPYFPVFGWGDTHVPDWIPIFKRPSQNTAYLPAPSQWAEQMGRPPFTVFMNQDLWTIAEEQLKSKYKNVTIHCAKRDGSILAIEVE